MENSSLMFRLTKYWWIPLLTGLAFIGFGVWLLCDPSASLKILAYIFAGCIGLIGIFNLFYGLGNSDSYGGYGFSLAMGIIEILFSIFLFFVPASALAWVFAYGTGIYIIFMAVYSFIESCVMSKNTTSLFWWLLLFLLAALVFSLIFILGPIGGAIMGWLYLGIAFITYGAYRVLFSLKMHKINEILRTEQ